MLKTRCILIFYSSTGGCRLWLQLSRNEETILSESSSYTGKHKSEIRQKEIHVSSWMWAGDRRVRVTKDGRSKYLKLRDRWDGLQVFFFPLLALQPPLWLYFTALYRALASSRTRLLDHTQRRATVGRTPLDEWSVRRRDLYLTTHNTHNRQISMPRVGFEPTISAGERPKTNALDRAATGTGLQVLLASIIVQKLQFFAWFRFMYLTAFFMFRFISDK